VLSGTRSMPEVSTRAYSYRADPATPEFDDTKPLFVFDGVCVLCSGGAGWVMRLDNQRRINFTTTQGAIGGALYKHYGVASNDSYLLVANGRAFTASRGYLELCGILGGWWRIVGVTAIIPESLRDRLYAFIARNRYRWLGKTAYCELLTVAQRSRLV
jgi:predicted DCC family thiol-disulfide oxidoreductase YuxK